jgi:hypothetical protein
MFFTLPLPVGLANLLVAVIISLRWRSSLSWDATVWAGVAARCRAGNGHIDQLGKRFVSFSLV